MAILPYSSLPPIFLFPWQERSEEGARPRRKSGLCPEAPPLAGDQAGPRSSGIRSLGHCHPDTKETGSSIQLISTQSIRARNQQGPVYMHMHQFTRQTPSDPNAIPRVILLMHSDASWRNRHGYRELTTSYHWSQTMAGSSHAKEWALFRHCSLKTLQLS